MNRFTQKNHYQILDINQNASQAGIQRAYHLMKKTFRQGSLAMYSLMNSSEIDCIQQRIEEAFKTLSNERERLYYDLTLSPDTQPDLMKPEPIGGNGKSTVKTLEASLDLELHWFLANIEEACSGKFLKKYREWMGIHLEEIAFETRINPGYLHMIEEDLYSGLPNEVYLRSYLQQYAKCLGINPKEAAEGFLKKFHYWKSTSGRV